VQGYYRLMEEITSQAADFWPTHVFIQAGVGSLAAAIALWFSFKCSEKMALLMPVIVIVEPKAAPCFFASAAVADGKPHAKILSEHTIMAGLDCGTPSKFAWEVLRDVADAFMLCMDTISKQGMKLAIKPLPGDPPIISGESAAVTLGAVNEILSNKNYSWVTEQLSINKDSTILLFSTEGDTDPAIYQQILL